MSNSKLEQLVRDWGYVDAEALIGDYIFDSVMPAICMNVDCDYSTEMEPDQDHGWCEVCGTNTLKSAEVLWQGML